MTATHPLKHLTTIDEWLRLGAARIFPPESRVELIDGEIFEMAPIGIQHASCVMRLTHLFAPMIDERAIINVQNPLQLGDLSAPQPDFMLLKPSLDFFRSRYPRASDVLLLIEISDTSVDFDRTRKLRLYAMHGVPEYWLVNLQDNCVELYCHPRADAYEQKSTLRVGDSITLSMLPWISIAVADIL